MNYPESVMYDAASYEFLFYLAGVFLLGVCGVLVWFLLKQSRRARLQCPDHDYYRVSGKRNRG